MNLKVVVIEDEAPSMQRLLRQLSEISAEIDVVETIESVAEGLLKLPQLKPDVIISDIELGDGLSFDLFKIAHPGCPVIFITAFNQYAIESFKANAIDYLLKPASKDDLKAALSKVQSRNPQPTPIIDYNALAEAILQKEKQKEKRFLIKIGPRFVTLNIEDVAFAYTENKIIYLVDKSGKRFPADQSLEQLESELGTERFFRINRSFIVCFDAICGMQQYTKGRVILQTNPPGNPDLMVVGADKSPFFKKWLAGQQ
jgi:two-component system, LytTR family, response regulator LytT